MGKMTASCHRHANTRKASTCSTSASSARPDPPRSAARHPAAATGSSRRPSSAGATLRRAPTVPRRRRPPGRRDARRCRRWRASSRGRISEEGQDVAQRAGRFTRRLAALQQLNRLDASILQRLDDGKPAIIARRQHGNRRVRVLRQPADERLYDRLQLIRRRELVATSLTAAGSSGGFGCGSPAESVRCMAARPGPRVRHARDGRCASTRPDSSPDR